jgi:predicted permease
MSDLILIAFPFFALILIGYASVKTKFVSNKSIDSMNAFVCWFALPAMLYGAIATRPLAEVFQPMLMVGYVFATLPVFSAALLIGRYALGHTHGTAAVLAVGATFPNSGYIGIPFLVALFGPSAAAPVVILVACDMLVIMPLAVMLIEAGRGGHAAIAALARVSRGLLDNPMLWSIVVGFAVSALEVAPPTPLARTLELLAAAAAPCALFALGGSLADRSWEGRPTTLSILSFLKLCVHPWLVFTVLSFNPAIPGDFITVAVVVAALPSAGTAFVIACQHDTGVAPVSGLILVSTLLSFVSMPIMVLLLT